MPSDALREEIRELRAAIEQLYALNELARLIGASENVEDTIKVLTRRTMKLINAEQAVITLQEGVDEGAAKTLFRTRLSASTSDTWRPHDLMVGWMQYHMKPLLINDPHSTTVVQGIPWDSSVHSVLSVPLIMNNQLVGLFTLYNKRGGGGFTKDDEKLLFIIASQSTQVIHNKRLIEERNRVKMIFGQHVSPSVAEDLLHGGNVEKSRKMTVCVMFMDIRGFTTFAEQHSPEEVMEYLNKVFGFMIECVIEHRGIVHRLLGDSFIALFGVPSPHKDDCQNAVDTARAMIQRLEEKCASGEVPHTRIGVGIHVGSIVVGTVGSENRKEFQINGDVVNLTARIEQLNKTFDSQLLISEDVYRLVNHEGLDAEKIDQVDIRGRKNQVVLYRLA